MSICIVAFSGTWMDGEEYGHEACNTTRNNAKVSTRRLEMKISNGNQLGIISNHRQQINLDGCQRLRGSTARVV
jgi:hypothetical protein